MEMHAATGPVGRSPRARRTIRLPGLALIATLAWLAQPLAGQYSRPSGGYSLDRVSADVAAAIRSELRSAEPRWDDILTMYFGAEGYDRGVPDLVLYIPAAGRAKQALLHKGAEVRDLIGQDFLYVVVFSERPIPAALPEGPHLNCSVRSIETAEDPVLTALVNALTDQLSASVAGPRVEQAEDATLALTLRDVRADTTAGDPLRVAMGRVRLGRNSLNRVTLEPAQGLSLDPHISLHSMFANSEGSRFGMSLGAGFTVNVNRPRFDEGEPASTDGYLRSSAYLFGHIYVNAPHLPVDRFSVGMAFGTNLLGGDLLDDLVLGLSIGRLDGLGIIVGANSLQWQVLDAGTGNVRNARRWRAFLGVDYGL